MESSHPDRKKQRQQLISAREALPAATRLQHESALLVHLQKLLEQLAAAAAGTPAGAASNNTLANETLAFCWPFRGEPDIRQLVTAWLATKPARKAALPVVIEQGLPLAFRHWTPDSIMAPDRYGIPTPSAGDLLTPSLVLIPVNGFDSRGFRLGYGGGYFDRTLAGLSPQPVSIGVGFELARLPRIAEASHDKPLDWIVTEAGAFKASGN